MAADKASAAILDFSDVKDGATFNKRRVPAGDYLAKVTKVADSPTKETKEPQWLYSIQLQEKYTDRIFPMYCKLVPNQLWKLRNLFLACGVAIPKKRVKLDPNRIVGKLLGVTLEDDEYDGKEQSNISQTFPASELDEDNTTDDDNEDEETEEDVDDAEEPEDDEEAEDTDEEDDEDAEEEEPEPVKAKIPAQRKSSPAAKKASPRRKVAAAKQVDDEELEELDLEDI